MSKIKKNKMFQMCKWYAYIKRLRTADLDGEIVIISDLG